MKHSSLAVSCIVSVLLFTGCTGKLSTVGTAPATLGYKTDSHQDLTSLPTPAGRIPVAVYSFRDQTGQYKPLPGATSFSTAVTQGATSMLVKALSDSKWFVPVEREGLQNLLTERKISRANLQSSLPEGAELPPSPKLINAQMIIEGGIIAYDSNLTTGGFGARFWGIGGSAEYQVDKVTLYIRAVDVNSGRILKSVSTSKTILSRAIDVNMYRYVSYNRLLEIETGVSTNEPPQMCVLEALEKAVTSLIIEGVQDGLWRLDNPNDINAQIILDYQEEKDMLEDLKKSDPDAVSTVPVLDKTSKSKDL